MSPDHCRWPPRRQLCPSFGILGATEGTATCIHTQVPPSTEQDLARQVPGKQQCSQGASAGGPPGRRRWHLGGLPTRLPGRPPACPGATFRVPNREDRTCDRPRHSENCPHPVVAVCPPVRSRPRVVQGDSPSFSQCPLTLCCRGAPVEPACTAPKLEHWTQTAEQPQCLQPHTPASLAHQGSCEAGAATHCHSGPAGIRCTGAPRCSTDVALG